MTNKHRELSIRSISWMNSRVTRSGMRWATEIALDLKSGWVADAAAFAFPQMRFYDQIKPKPLPNDKYLYVFESKVSRQDFNKSFSGKYDTHKIKPIGNLNYIVTTKNLIKPEELPEGWGWLMQSGNGLKEMVSPPFYEIQEELKYQIAWRMLWTAYNYRSSIEDWELRSTQLF